MFIVYPTNVDYLIDDVRLRLGDLDGTTYSDSIVRAAIIAGVKFLQRRWGNRYLIYASGSVISPLPAGVSPITGYEYISTPNGNGFIPVGYVDNDVFRNPYHTFSDTSSSPLSQEDESVVVAAAVLTLIQARVFSSSSVFVNWSDGKYSYSNVASSTVLRDAARWALDELNGYFKQRLARPLRDGFPEILI